MSDRRILLLVGIPLCKSQEFLRREYSRCQLCSIHHYIPVILHTPEAYAQCSIPIVIFMGDDIQLPLVRQPSIKLHSPWITCMEKLQSCSNTYTGGATTQWSKKPQRCWKHVKLISSIQISSIGFSNSIWMTFLSLRKSHGQRLADRRMTHSLHVSQTMKTD